ESRVCAGQERPEGSGEEGIGRGRQTRWPVCDAGRHGEADAGIVTFDGRRIFASGATRGSCDGTRTIMTRRSLTSAGFAALLVVGLLAGCGKQSPEAQVASARQYLAKNDRTAAIVELRNALQQNPDLAEARFLLGKALLDNEDYAGAQKELRRAKAL